jgi:hypothetical protein
MALRTLPTESERKQKEGGKEKKGEEGTKLL